jgi:hypothetical protein
MLKLAVEESSSCGHILYAACHDLRYLAQLEPYAHDVGLKGKITLVHGPGFRDEFKKFGFGVASFPAVFRWSDLPPTTKGRMPNGTLKTDVANGKALRAEEDMRTLMRKSTSAAVVSMSNGRNTSMGVDTGVPKNSMIRNLRTLEIPCKYFAHVSPSVISNIPLTDTGGIPTL